MAGVPSLGGPGGPRANGAPAREANAAEPETAPSPGRPWLSFEVEGVRPVPHAAAPTLSFTLGVRDGSGRPVFAVALTIQIQLEPVKRSYDDATRERLAELFGEPGRWGTTARRMSWSTESVLVGPFRESTDVEVPVLCNYDHEIAATKYFSALPDGEVPLVWHFNGTVYYEAEDGRLQVVQIPWDSAAEYRMPVASWREMIARHYPHRGWVALDRETVVRLDRLKAERGLHTIDQVVTELIDRTGRPGGGERG